MVTITGNMQVAGTDEYVVTTADGDYADTDLILCAAAENPGTPIAMFQAQFVKYGPIVYQFETPEDLGEAIHAIDPDSTLDAVALYKEQEARDAARAAGTLEPSDPVPATDSPAQDEAPVPENNDQEADTQFFRQEAASDTASSTATSTPELPDVPGGEVLGEATSTPIDTATSTPDSVPPEPVSAPVEVGNMSTTTPAVPDVPSAIDLSTTTPE